MQLTASAAHLAQAENALENERKEKAAWETKYDKLNSATLAMIAHQDAFQREEIERNKPLDAALKAYESELDNRKSRKRRHTQIHHPYRQSVEACLTPTKNGATPMAPGHSAKEEMKNKSK
jgi:hypothetical protein